MAIMLPLLITLIVAVGADSHAVCGSWSAGTALPTARLSVTVNQLPVYEGDIYMVGGWSDTARIPDTTIYSIDNDHYSSGANYPDTGIAGSAQVLHDGKIYVFGGVLQSTKWYTDQLYIYNIASDSWSTGTDVPWSAEGMFAVLDPTSGLIYIGGGCEMPVTVHDEWYAYDPATDTWTEKETMPMVGGNGVAGYHDGNIYIACGTRATERSDNDPPWRYDVDTDTWTVLESPIPTKVVLAGGGLFQGRLYIFGGKTSMSGSYTDAVQIYDIARNGWLVSNVNHKFEPVPVSYGYTQGAFVDSTFYMFGGWDERTKYAALYEYDIPVNMIRIIVIVGTALILIWMTAMVTLTLHKTRRTKTNGKR